MIKHLLKSIFVVLLIANATAQTTYTVQPDGTTGIDSWVLSEYTPNNDTAHNYGTDARLDAWRWTNTGVPYTTRGYLKFDVSSIPTSAVVCSAILTVHSDVNNNMSGYTKSNASYLRRATSAWTQSVIAWYNQPSLSTTDTIPFGPITGTTTGTSYTIDITSQMQDMIKNPSTNYGWAVMLKNESSTYAALGLASSNHATASYRPMLTVVYVSSLTVTPTSTAICSGNSTGITASGASTYSWTPSSGLSATTGTNVTASPTVSTTYTITGTTGSCTAKATSTVTVNATPTVTVNSATVCAGNSAALTTTVSPSGTYTYSWAPSSGLSSTTTASVTATPTATIVYTITVTSSAGCVGIITSTVTVNPLPTISIATTPTPAIICSGQSGTLTASGAVTYTWNTGATTASISGSLSATTTFTVTGTSSLTCTNKTTITVTVNPTPTVTVNSATVCSGNSAALTTTVSPAGTYTYSWAPSSGLSSTTTASVTATPSATTVYTVTVTSSSGCVGTKTSTVTVNATPTLTVNSPTVAMCNGNSTTLTVTGNGTTYSWTPSSGLSATTGTNVTATPTITTTYTITATLGSCTAKATSAITINPLPNVTVNSDTIYASLSGTLTASGATTYSWTPSTGLSATTGSTVIATPTVTTIYTVTGTLGTCTAIATSTVTNLNLYFRSTQTGNWSTNSTWQSSLDNATWTAATSTPSYKSRSITIQTGHKVTIPSSVKIDETVVNGALIYGNNTGNTLTINDGTGIDLTINGSFQDNSPDSVVWLASSTWTLGTNDTLQISSNIIGNGWRTNYSGGISSIPSNAYWILNKTGTMNPSLYSNAGMYYPNLIIQNNTGTIWTTSAASSFTGTAGYPTIQGNMSIGGNGTGYVSFLDTNTNAQAMLVQGNFTVTTGSIFRNHGTGCEVQGNFVLNGTVDYGTSSGMILSGSNNQTISGSSLSFKNINLNKSSFAATVTLNAAAAITGAFTFTKGVLVTDTVHLLTFNAGSSTTGVNDSSFVSGPVKKIGNTAFTFPIGKGNNGQTLGISAPMYTTDAFQAEYFNTNPTVLDSNLTDTTFDYVSTCEYFKLKRKNGTSNVQPTLSYDLYSCVTQLAPAPRVIGFNGTKWKDLGASNLTYSSYGGTISTATVITQYGDITLGNNTKGGFSPIDSVFFNLNPYLTFDPEPMDSTIPFYENLGQIVDTGYHSLTDIKYYSFNQTPAVYFRPTSASFLFSKLDTIRSTPDSLHRVDMAFYGANPISNLSPAEPIQAYLNYYLGYRPHPDTNINGYQRLFVPNVYNNIDLQYYTNTDGVKYCLVVKPGAKPSIINLLFTGASSTYIDGSGRLVVTTTLGTLTLDVPILYQMNSSLIVTPLSGTVSWYQISTNKFGITLPAYNAAMPLFIEVKKANVGTSGFANQLCWSTYYGGSSIDYAYGIANDANGNTLIAGETLSPNLPQPGPLYVTTGAGTTQAFVTRFKHNKALHFSNIIGCRDGTYANDVKAKSPNDIFICGQAGKQSASTTFGSFFVNPGGGAFFNSTFNPTLYYTEPFIMDFDSTGHVKYGTFIKNPSNGGSGFANAMDFDSNGNLYVVGQQSNIPPQTKSGGYNNTSITTGAYIIELSNTYSQLWGTYIDASSYATAAKVDPSNNLWIFGSTLGSTLPTNATGSAYIDNTFSGASDNFLAKFSSAGVQLWTTYLGGSSTEYYTTTGGTNSIAFSSNSVYFTGSTSSNNFPIKNAGGGCFYDNTLSASTSSCPYAVGDGYVVEFDMTTMAQNWGTYVSGNGCSAFLAASVDPTTGNLVVAGSTGDTGIPLIPNGGAYYQNQFSTTTSNNSFLNEGYMITFNPSRQAIWATLYGGNDDNGGNNSGNSIQDMSFASVDPSTLYITGYTASENNTTFDPNSLNPAFPLYSTGSPVYLQSTYNGGNSDAFVANFCLSSTFAGIASVQSGSGDALHIYPNPASDMLYIELPKPNNNGTFAIYDISGQEVYKGQYKNDSPIVSVNTSSFASGIYIVKIMGNQGVSIGKFIKE